METKQRICEAVIKESLDVTISKISTINVSLKAKTSEANIFRIYKNKTNLLKETFLYIDNQIGVFLNGFNIKIDYTSLDELFEQIKSIWIRYLEFFKNNKTYVHYYQAFRLSKYYNNEIAKLQEDNYKILISNIYILQEKFKLFDKISFNLFWSFLLDSTLLFAKRICDDSIEYNNTNLDLMFHLIFDGIRNIINTL